MIKAKSDNELVDDVLDVLTLLLDVVCIHDPRDAGTDGEHANLACVRAMKDDVCGVRGGPKAARVSKAPIAQLGWGGCCPIRE